MFNKKPSKILIGYIEGKGTGTEIDELVHGKFDIDRENYLIKPILAISKKYSNQEYPIGISNPDCFPEIRKLAENLRRMNM